MAAARRTGSPPLAVGCLLAIPGFFGGGMIAVGVGMMVDGLTRCVAPPELPVCNTFVYMLTGGLIGVVLLPGVAIWLMRRRRPGGNSDRS
jgi:hypothetical protein